MGTIGGRDPEGSGARLERARTGSDRGQWGDLDTSVDF